jgi:hypothetical protein
MNLQAFCHKSRVSVMKPVLFGGYIWATTGQIAVRFPDGSKGEKPGYYPDILDLFKTYPVTTCDISTPLIRYKTDLIEGPCPKCKGTREKCLTCAGGGYTACPACRQDVKCEICGGIGTIPVTCPDCRPTGSVYIETQIPCDFYFESIDLWISGENLELILSNLNDVKFGIACSEFKFQNICFRSIDGVEGLCSPKRKPASAIHELKS